MVEELNLSFNPKILSWELVPFDFVPAPVGLQNCIAEMAVTQDIAKKYYSGRIGSLLDHLGGQYDPLDSSSSLTRAVIALKDFPLSDILSTVKVLVYLVGFSSPKSRQSSHPRG